MILLLSLGFGLGVLACVAADAIERRRAARRRPICIVLGSAFESPRRRAEAAQAAVDALFQDSTLPAKDS